MADEKRFAYGYEVIQSMEIDRIEIIVGENPEAEKPYITWRRSPDKGFGEESHMLPLYSGDYLTAMREFTRQINAGLDALGLDRVYRGSASADAALTAADCIEGGMKEDLRGKAVVVRAEALLPEYRARSHQLMLAVGGFGCAPDARGRAVFGVNVYSGAHERWDRRDILGVAAERSIPKWARDRLAALQAKSPSMTRESVLGKLRENRSTAPPRDFESPSKPFHKSGPELLLPAALRPLASVIPSGTDKAEIDDLAARVDGMSEAQRDTFYAVVEAGWHCGSAAEIINITENLNCFELRPGLTAEGYGTWLMESAGTGACEIIRRLERSDHPGERDLATHIARLEASVGAEAYGLAEAEAERGAFTSKGYITEEAEVRMVYRGPNHTDAVMTQSDCAADGMGEDLRGKVIAIKADVFLPEYRSVQHQLYLATGGFGCAPDARGRAVFGTNLHTGERTRWNRSQVLGIVKDEAVPEWARTALAALQKIEEKESEMSAKEQESVLEKIRQSKREPSAQRRPKIMNSDKSGPER